LNDCASAENNPEHLNLNLPDKPPLTLDEVHHFGQLLPQAYTLLQSDFNMSGIETEWPVSFGESVFELRKIVADKIASSGGPTTEAFYRLLYRADIRETELKKALNNSVNIDFITSISEILIIRALQRAYYREKYRSEH
jgi:hypothetical protein